MIDVQPFIRQAWLDDLRSGEFHQARGSYRIPPGPSPVSGGELNCCLAVAERTFQKFNPDWDTRHALGGGKEGINGSVLGLKNAATYMHLNDIEGASFLEIAEAAEREFLTGRRPQVRDS